MAIGHTRWATCGGKEDHNAHPHSDHDGEVTLVHNGTILNHRQLKDSIVAQGIEFSSETDTEVIAQLIGLELKAGKEPMEAIESTIEKLEGTWGLVIIFKNEPDHIYCAQNGSHIVIGFGDESVLLASEARAFEKYTKNILDMKDGEIFKLGKNEKGDYTILNKHIQKLQTPKVER
jgi:glucosamine--fructose-6-phosphate aminotransferase (isomerizing)